MLPTTLYRNLKNPLKNREQRSHPQVSKLILVGTLGTTSASRRHHVVGENPPKPRGFFRSFWRVTLTSDGVLDADLETLTWSLKHPRIKMVGYTPEN